MERLETYGLATAGLVGGLAKYYRPAPSTLAWATLGLGVLAYDILAPQGETLSEGADRALERHKLLTMAAIGTVALHLANIGPDPIHKLVEVLR